MKKNCRFHCYIRHYGVVTSDFDEKNVFNYSLLWSIKCSCHFHSHHVRMKQWWQTQEQSPVAIPLFLKLKRNILKICWKKYILGLDSNPAFATKWLKYIILLFYSFSFRINRFYSFYSFFSWLATLNEILKMIRNDFGVERVQIMMVLILRFYDKVFVHFNSLKFVG